MLSWTFVLDLGSACITDPGLDPVSSKVWAEQHRAWGNRECY